MPVTIECNVARDRLRSKTYAKIVHTNVVDVNRCSNEIAVLLDDFYATIKIETVVAIDRQPYV